MKIRTIVLMLLSIIILGGLIGCSNNKAVVEGEKFEKIEGKIKGNIGTKTSLQPYNLKVHWIDSAIDEQNKLINKIIGDIKVVSEGEDLPEKYIVLSYDNMNIYFLLEDRSSGENVIIEIDKKFYLGKLEKIEIDKIREYIITQGLMEK
ncbi:hypothetical protein ACQPU1_16140 [Clostridium paraputrificum]|uniref:hypothetical protein n=1 Tax=Clostridium TaxID=1485 RepID=UPI003D33C3DC